MVKLYVTFASIMYINNLQAKTQFVCRISSTKLDRVVPSIWHLLIYVTCVIAASFSDYLINMANDI